MVNFPGKRYSATSAKTGQLLSLGLLMACLQASPLFGTPPAARVPEGLLGGTGEIDGRGAIGIYPAGRFDAATCTAHVVVENDFESEISHPCVEWALPPAYALLRVWAEDGANMSPYPERFTPRDAAPGMIVEAAALAPAGRVVLRGLAEENSRVVLRLLDADPLPLRAGDHPHENLRSVPPARWEEGVLMPAGEAVGWLWDPERRQILALSKSFSVPAGRSTQAPITAGGGHVVAILARPIESPGIAEDLSLEIRTSTGKRAPDLVVPTANRYYAFFYGGLEGSLELAAHTETLLLPLQQFEIREGAIELVSADLVRRPQLEAELRLPQELQAEKLTLEVVDVATRVVVDSRQLSQHRSNEIFENLSADLFELRLASSLGTFGVRADLRPALDLTVQLEPELIEVKGQVLLEGEGHPALLKFTTTRGEILEARADDLGQYRLLTVAALRFVSVALENGQAPFVDFFEKPLVASRILDFELDAGGHKVTVLSSKTGRPIPGALVAISNSFPADPAESRPMGDKPRLKTVAQAVTTGEDGSALLPSLRPGTLGLRASAAGYRNPTEPSSYSIEKQDRSRTFEIKLDPLGPLLPLQLQKADGSPAAGAEVALVSELDSEQVLFTATCDAEGLAQVPADAGLLLIRHPESASRWLPWPAATAPATLRLEAAAPPLVLRIENAERRPLPRAEVALWLGGRKVQGSLLSWLFRTRNSADPDGYLHLHGVPAAPLAALAWAPAQLANARNGAFDAQAVSVNPPFPATVVLQGFE